MWEKQTGLTLDQARHQAEISLERLRQIGAFYGMSDEVLAETRTLLRTEEYSAGRVVNRQGDYGASLYIIVRGTVELLMERSASDVSRVAVLQEGDAFGESSLWRLSRNRRPSGPSSSACSSPSIARNS
jgi:CRP-like cAMP-binding protein